MSILKTIYPKLLLIFIGLFIINSLQAQSYEFLKHKWLHAKSDTARVNAGLRLIINYYRGNDDSFFIENKLLHKIYNQAKKINYDKGIIESSYRLGDNYIFQSKLPLAIEFYYLSLKKSEEVKDWTGVAKSKRGIGLVYYTQSNWSKAIEFFEGSLMKYRLTNQIRQVGIQQYLIGISLYSLNRLEKAKLFLDSAISIKKQSNDSVGINECLLGIANIYKAQRNYDTAVQLYNYLLPILSKQKEYVPISLLYCSLSEIEFEKKNYGEALIKAKKAFYFSDLFPELLPKLQASKILYKIYKSTGDFKNAFNFFQTYNVLKDSVENSDFASSISLAQATYEFEKEQSAIKTEQEKKDLNYKLELKNKNRNQLILSIIAFVSILVVVIIIFAYRIVSKQRKVSEDLLLNILPKETAMELKKFGKAIPKSHTGVTIMFCDVKNFTTLAEKLTPEQLVEMLDHYFKKFDLILSRLGLEKIKTIGDAYMCAGGLTSQANEAAINMVQAAIEFLNFIDEIETEMIRKYFHSFSFRIGIHTGNVVSGVVGLNKYSYDIWGDAVNTAARMEQNSENGKINISGSTNNLVKNTFTCVYRGKIPAKNKGEIDMYYIERN